MQIKITWSWYWSFQLKSNPGTRCLFQSKPSLLSSMAIYFFLSSWAGSILQILQSDWFWEWAVFLPSGPLTAGGIQKNVSKFSWKPFKSLFNIITQINMFWWNFSLSFALPLFSLLSTRSQIVPFMENLALITALYPSGSFRKKIKMLFTSQSQSVLGKTVPSVLCTKTSSTVFPDTDRPWLVNNIYNFWTIEVS